MFKIGDTVEMITSDPGWHELGDRVIIADPMPYGFGRAANGVTDLDGDYWVDFQDDRKFPIQCKSPMFLKEVEDF